MENEQQRRAALVYHAKPRPGKTKIVPTKNYDTQRDLALAYSPGVAIPCIEIAQEESDVYKYTNKGNLVAVISNGTAVLGLGDIGPSASKPVMEGKALLFKIFAGIDVFDIEVDAKDPEKFIEAVKAIAPTFGGINLEDIKSPEAFEIERRLKDELDIPVMHDDQHGTAIISAAALLNALELAEKKIEDVTIVVSGAGAAAISCTKLYVAFGAKIENIVMLDSKGVIKKSRENLTPEKAQFATSRSVSSLEEALVDADVFIGLSQPKIVTQEMLKKMAANPIVFAMANREPEIGYEEACEARKDIIMATGRSDHPNQVNNVLGFPFIFRGALDVRATKINEAMKMAAVKALADLAKEPVPEQVNIAYGETRLAFSREYIIPKPFDPRLISEIPPAIAKAAMESGVAKEPIEDWDKYKEALMQRSGNDNKIVRLLHTRAKMNAKKIVFAEADHLDVLKAAQIVYDEGIAIPILLGNKTIIEELKAEIEFEADLEIIDPTDNATRTQRNAYATSYWEQRRRTGVTQYQAEIKMRERNYFSAMMVLMGDADGMISGYSRAYPTVVKPILEVIGRANNVKRVATTNIMITERGPMFLSDTSINIDPSAETIAETAQMTANVAKTFGFESVTALLSYANFGSSSHPNANKVKHQEKFPFSKLAGKKVNTLIFPNVESANITYKLMKELNGADSIGPIMMGLRKSVHILQLGASVDEIVNMAAVAVIDAQEREKRKRAKMAKS